MGLEKRRKRRRPISDDKVPVEMRTISTGVSFASHESRDRNQGNAKNGNKGAYREFSPLNSCGRYSNKGNGLWVAGNEEVDAVEKQVNTHQKYEYPDHDANENHYASQKLVKKHESQPRNFKRHSKRITSTGRWKALRVAALRRDGFKCRACGASGRLEVDHIEPVRTHPERAFDLSNLQALCAACHSRKTRIECGFSPPSPERLAWRQAVKELSNRKVIPCSQA